MTKGDQILAGEGINKALHSSLAKIKPKRMDRNVFASFDFGGRGIQPMTFGIGEEPSGWGERQNSVAYR